jgi:hypothetical protein
MSSARMKKLRNLKKVMFPMIFNLAQLCTKKFVESQPNSINEFTSQFMVIENL